MRCKSCEVVIRDRLMGVSGVKNAKANLDQGFVDVVSTPSISRVDLQRVIGTDGYKLFDWDERKETLARYGKIGLSFIVVLGIYYLLYSFDFFPSPGDLSVDIGLGAALILGFSAAFSSCAATSGAMLLALDNGAIHGEQSRLKTNVLFNAGRILSYGFFGALFGLLGAIVGISQNISLFVTIILSLFMIFLGLKMLKVNIFGLNVSLGVSDFFSRMVNRFGESHPSFAIFLAGASTFFLPCGFTQALQLYVLGRGGAIEGLMIMLVFALGSLPGLLSIGLASKLLSAKFRQFAFYFSGTAILVVGVLNIGGSLNALGYYPDLAYVTQFFEEEEGARAVLPTIRNVEREGDEQIAKMKVVGLDYYPSKFYVQSGKKVRWIIDGSEARGCARVITSPQLGVTKMIPKDKPLVISFTPRTAGNINFSCTMGMTTPGAAFVVQDVKG